MRMGRLWELMEGMEAVRTYLIVVSRAVLVLTNIKASRQGLRQGLRPNALSSAKTGALVVGITGTET